MGACSSWLCTEFFLKGIRFNQSNLRTSINTLKSYETRHVTKLIFQMILRQNCPLHAVQTELPTELFIHIYLVFVFEYSIPTILSIHREYSVVDCRLLINSTDSTFVSFIFKGFTWIYQQYTVKHDMQVLSYSFSAFSLLG